MKKKTKEPFIQFGTYYSSEIFTQRCIGILYMKEPREKHWHIIIDLFKWYIEFTFDLKQVTKRKKK